MYREHIILGKLVHYIHNNLYYTYLLVLNVCFEYWI